MSHTNVKINDKTIKTERPEDLYSKINEALFEAGFSGITLQRITSVVVTTINDNFINLSCAGGFSFECKDGIDRAKYQAAHQIADLLKDQVVIEIEKDQFRTNWIGTNWKCHMSLLKGNF